MATDRRTFSHAELTEEVSSSDPAPPVVTSLAPVAVALGLSARGRGRRSPRQGAEFGRAPAVDWDIAQVDAEFPEVAFGVGHDRLA